MYNAVIEGMVDTAYSTSQLARPNNIADFVTALVTPCLQRGTKDALDSTAPDIHADFKAQGMSSSYSTTSISRRMRGLTRRMSGLTRRITMTMNQARWTKRSLMRRSKEVTMNRVRWTKVNMMMLACIPSALTLTLLCRRPG